MNITFEEAVRRGWLDATDVPKGQKTNKPRKSEIEGDEQSFLITQFRLSFPELGPLLIHIPNGGSRKNAFEGWRLKTQGVRAGVSDLLLPVARQGFHGLFIEFKAAPPNASPATPAQLEWLELVRSQGYRGELCLGPANAMAVLRDYLAAPNP